MLSGFRLLDCLNVTGCKIRNGYPLIGTTIRADIQRRSCWSSLNRIALVSLFLLFTVAVPAWPQGAYTFTTINAPSAGTGVLQGTIPININSAGDVTGVYFGASNFPLAHGFVRTADGTLTEFDATGAGTDPGQGTIGISINTTGVVAGMYIDANRAYRGFVRAANGTITTFDAPGAATTVVNRGTIPLSINDAGVITGRYAAADGAYHGFIRAANGTITTFDISGAGTEPAEGTVPISINPAGVITGVYYDTSAVMHGFVRAANGAITIFDAPGAGTGFGEGTLGASINAAGEIVGGYVDTAYPEHSHIVYGRAFVRAANGVVTPFDPPGADPGTGQVKGSFALSINAAGVVAGTYSDSSGVLHGFVRAADGTITAPVDAPGTSTSGLFPGTVCASINDWGKITGAYTDSSGAIHGFVATPGATFQTTLEDIKSSLRQGLINRGMASALSAQIRAASRAAAGGNTNAARRILTAFTTLVNAQTGRQINETAAEVLLADANALLSQL